MSTAHTETAQRSDKDRKFISALARGLDVLVCFMSSDRVLGNQEIAKRTGLPKSTVSRVTYTLTELGYLRYFMDQNRYCLGKTLIGLGYSMLAQMHIRRIARPLMQALAEYTQASVNLGIRDRQNMVYIDTYRNSATFTVQLDVGSQIPIATTSMGRAYLCALPEMERIKLMGQIRKSDENNWPKIKPGIEQALVDYKKRGFCYSLREWREEVSAVSVPLVASDNSEIMVFSCSGASFQLNRELFEKDIGPRLLNLVGNVKTALSQLNV
ncbi:MAG: IclR family transcriptional regulator [Desulfuromonadaceae bacterium]|nr:IclR family transcriptional regulator [Desulfuromonadaceae bacterium]